MTKTKVVFIKDALPHGEKGDVKEVAGGFFRNALFSRGIAALATPHLIKQAETIQQKRKEAEQMHYGRMEAYVKKLEGVVLEFTKKANEQGGLFDAVDTREILQVLHEKGFEAIEEKHIDMDRPFDKIGEYTVALSLGENFSMPSVKIIITKEE